MLYLLDVRINNKNLNLKNEFFNWTIIQYPLVLTSMWRQKPSNFYDFWCTKSTENLTPEVYRCAHLTCILWPHYLKKWKSFSTMSFICASEWLNKMDYNSHNAAAMQVTLPVGSVLNGLPLREHNCGDCYATVLSPHPQWRRSRGTGGTSLPRISDGGTIM